MSRVEREGKGKIRKGYIYTKYIQLEVEEERGENNNILNSLEGDSHYLSGWNPYLAISRSDAQMIRFSGWIFAKLVECLSKP
jgi:hypothetical protein